MLKVDVNSLYPITGITEKRNVYTSRFLVIKHKTNRKTSQTQTVKFANDLQI